MLAGLATLFDRSKGAWRWWARSYEGASAGRRTSGWGKMANQHGAAQAARAPLAQRARYLVANNPHAAAAKAAWVAALVGTGIVPATTGKLAERWTAWTDEADADGVCDFYGLTALMVGGMIVDGEALALMIATPGGLRIRVLHPDQLDASLTRPLAAGGRIVNGVEFDVFGTRVAYWIIKERPEIGLGLNLQPVRVPAEDVIHLFRPDFPGQVRGVSWFAPAILRLAEHDEWHGAQLTRQKVGALLAGVITTNDGAVPFGGEAQGEAIIGSLEPGAMVVLPPGKDVSFSNPPAIAQEANDFARITLHEIAAALGLPYEVLTGDLSEVNYSSIRAGLVEWRRRIEMIQHNVIVFQALRPIWRRWVMLESLAGRIEGRIEDLLPVRWITPKQQWVDPGKDVQAEIDAINAGLMSRREAVAARGMDVAALDAEIAADKAREAGLGLSFVTPAKAPASALSNIGGAA
ncbi:lambda family phage portal protein [Ancylobacter sp. 3268]|uniref:phage portal protein n=1 Tax=Ancylobacter sp. 3268 TaxID=2817752 RepID=UPI00285D3FB5|nr:phage portal protein [Ancylobacter sp. 3268]MDR6955245.1 lambda family phage portal protein [Ancylobacter sp. 3268]